MKRRVLDLFCGAGGASMGYSKAGFEVVGIDINEQRNYPFTFHKGNALKVKKSFLQTFDLIHASPPCQSFSAYRRRGAGVGYSALNLIPETRALLQESGIPYIIENVVGAPLLEPVSLCGSMFRLDVKRHRLFETSFELCQPKCNHSIWTRRFPPATNRTNLRKTVEVGVWRIPIDVQSAAMGINWMNRVELSQAIPPAYTRYLAHQFSRMSGRKER